MQVSLFLKFSDCWNLVVQLRVKFIIEHDVWTKKAFAFWTFWRLFRLYGFYIVFEFVELSFFFCLTACIASEFFYVTVNFAYRVVKNWLLALLFYKQSLRMEIINVLSHDHSFLIRTKYFLNDFMKCLMALVRFSFFLNLIKVNQPFPSCEFINLKVT